MTTQRGASPQAVRTGPVLAVVALALMTVMSAVSGLNVALPDLARATGASQSQLTWIVDAYTVVFAGLLLFAGALGDRFGRRGLLALGLAIFGCSALAGLFVSDPETLIVVRIFMGVGAAAIMPTTLSVITSSFPVEQRPRAIGVWVGVAGGGAAIGVFVSALLLEWFSWSSFFALNVVLAAVSLVGTLMVVPTSVDPQRQRLDLPGAVLSLAWISLLVFGIIEGSDRGWGSAITLASFGVGAVALVAFVVWELRTAAPMLDPRLFANRIFSAGVITIAAQFFAAFGFFFIALQYLQFVLGRSPLQAALMILPLPFMLIPLARSAPLLADRFGFGRVSPLGLVLLAAGLGTLAFLDVSVNYLVFYVGLVLFALGMGLSGTPATTAITRALPDAKQGVASAVNDTAREVGSAFGIAILGSLLNSSYRAGVADAAQTVREHMGERAAEAIRGSIAFTSSEQVQALGRAADPVVAGARQAFVDGVGLAFAVAAGVAAVAAVAVAILGREPQGHNDTAGSVAPQDDRSAEV